MVLAVSLRWTDIQWVFLAIAIWTMVPKWIKKDLMPGRRSTSRRLKQKHPDAVDSLRDIFPKFRHQYAHLLQCIRRGSGPCMPAYKAYITALAFKLCITKLKRRHQDLVHRVFNDDRATSAGLDFLRNHIEPVKLSILAYESDYDNLSFGLKKHGYDLLRRDIAEEPTRASYFVALNSGTKTVVIAVRGTLSTAEAITATIAVPTEIPLYSPFDEKYCHLESFYAHDSIGKAALLLCNHLDMIIKEFVLPLDYKVKICGHSLGGGVAVVLGLLLRSRFKQLQKNYDMVQVSAFGLPPVVNYEVAMAIKPWVTCFVNDCDFVPRINTTNVKLAQHLILAFEKRLAQNMLSPDSLIGALLCVLDGINPGSDPVLRIDELVPFFQCFRQHHDWSHHHNNYVPGTVIHTWSTRPVASSNSQINAVVLDGTLRGLGHVFATPGMLLDHMYHRYEESLVGLVKRLESECAQVHK